MKPPEIINSQTVRINHTINVGLGSASERQTKQINPMGNIAPRLRNKIRNVEPFSTEIRLNQLAMNSDTNCSSNTTTRVLKIID